MNSPVWECLLSYYRILPLHQLWRKMYLRFFEGFREEFHLDRTRVVSNHPWNDPLKVCIYARLRHVSSFRKTIISYTRCIIIKHIPLNFTFISSWRATSWDEYRSTKKKILFRSIVTSYHPNDKSNSFFFLFLIYIECRFDYGV